MILSYSAPGKRNTGDDFVDGDDYEDPSEDGSQGDTSDAEYTTTTISDTTILSTAATPFPTIIVTNLVTSTVTGKKTKTFKTTETIKTTEVIEITNPVSSTTSASATSSTLTNFDFKVSFKMDPQKGGC
ncbi:hypothetical protein UCDDA912_g00911 [Diaporthe ampelina]|uniref:Uncharacterized protein n=1 Tax=Diaporthe ampelina TaxID=1214573 RepID=A0A0G2FYR4_9PEZI|nr:hypothetical protein UCDDA912_g00911 [Diaporthe ampelina]